jgi:hypothetical protein
VRTDRRPPASVRLPLGNRLIFPSLPLSALPGQTVHRTDGGCADRRSMRLHHPASGVRCKGGVVAVFLRTDEELEIPFSFPARRVGVRVGSFGPFPQDQGEEEGKGSGDHEGGEAKTAPVRFHTCLPMCRRKPAFPLIVRQIPPAAKHEWRTDRSRPSPCTGGKKRYNQLLSGTMSETRSPRSNLIGAEHAR